MRQRLILTAFLCLTAFVPVQAEEEQPFHVLDEAGLLTDVEEDELSSQAAEISREYGCGLYMVSVKDYTVYAPGSVTEAAIALYQGYDLGMGQERNGTLLLLSMADRDYAIVSYGNAAHTAFTDYAKEWLADGFLDAFGDDSWYEGFGQYLDGSRTILRMAAEDTPLEKDTDPARLRTAQMMRTAVIFFVPLAAALAVTMILKSRMKSVAMKREARHYAVSGRPEISRQTDLYTHTTEVRHRIERNTGSSGGTTVGGSGFSSHSGKF